MTRLTPRRTDYHGVVLESLMPSLLWISSAMKWNDSETWVKLYWSSYCWVSTGNVDVFRNVYMEMGRFWSAFKIWKGNSIGSVKDIDSILYTKAFIREHISSDWQDCLI